MVVTHTHQVATRGQGDVRDLTPAIEQALKSSGLRAGIVTVFVPGSTAGVTTIEYESGVVTDLAAVLERLVPRDHPYDHHRRWGDDNGSGHVRAGLIGPSLVVPFRDGRLMLGAWQQPVLVECDTRPRTRQVVIQILGE